MKYAKLIYISADNNNKYYEMQEVAGGNFHVKYGRVEQTVQIGEYPMSKWFSKYNEKIRKGYKDVTELVSVTSYKTEYVDEPDVNVNQFVLRMRKYMDNLVNTTYKKAENVTKAQVEKAQQLLDELKWLKDKDKVNAKLIELYSVIPRNMRDTRDWLLPNINIEEVLQNEQDNIDAVKSYVSTLSDKPSLDKTYFESIGAEMFVADKNQLEPIKHILGQLRNYKQVYVINKPSENEVFESFVNQSKNKQTSLLLHGTRCSSVLPIIEQGLKIRPSGNYHFSGKAYGNGCYFSEITTKSLNYTGNDSDKVLFVYEVHVGNPFVYNGWYTGNPFELCEKELNKRGFDSTYVKAGNGLMNSEIIVYNEKQFRLKYLIHI